MKNLLSRRTGPYKEILKAIWANRDQPGPTGLCLAYSEKRCVRWLCPGDDRSA